MINIDFFLGISIYLLVMIAGLMLVWLRQKDSKTKDLVSQPECIWMCSVCLCTYFDCAKDSISICPRCKSYVKKEERR